MTGYDAQLLNTLYVDRSLELHGLVQAYSRTNRVHGPDKEFGSITLSVSENDGGESRYCIKLYGTGGTSSKAIVEPYDTAVEQLNIKMKEMKLIMSDLTTWQEIQNDTETKKYFY